MSTLPRKRHRSCAGGGHGPRVKRERVQEEFHKWRKARAAQGRDSKQFYSVLPTAAWAERRHRLLHAPHSSPPARGSRWIFRMFGTQATAFDFADSMNSESPDVWEATLPTWAHAAEGPRIAASDEEMEDEQREVLQRGSTSSHIHTHARERAEVFAFEKAMAAEAGAGGGAGRRAYAVCTYSSLWSLYSRPYLHEEDPLPTHGTRQAGEAVPRNFYEVLREGMAAQLYFDLEYQYDDGDNVEKEPGKMVYWLKRLVCHGLMAHYGIPCSEEQVLDLYSPSATKFSMHLLVRLGHLSSQWLPNGFLEVPVAFASNIQCGRFVQMLLSHLVEGTAVPPHPRKAEYMAGFLDLVRSAISEEDASSTLVTMSNSALMERLYHKEIGRDLLTFSVGTCVRGIVTSSYREDDIDESTLASLLDVMEEEPEPKAQLANGPEHEEVTMDFAELRSLFTISTSKGSSWFVDTGVYTRNRNFRLLGSHKQGRFYSPLLLSPTSTYSLPEPMVQPSVKSEPGVTAGLPRQKEHTVPAPGGEVQHFEACLQASRESFSVEASKKRVDQHAEQLHQALFMHSLVCHEVSDTSTASRLRLTCPFRILPGGATAWVEADDASTGGGHCSSGGFTASGMAESPFQGVDSFITQAADEEGGSVRSWIHYKDSNTLVYNVVGMRCFNIGRPHKSNANLLVANLLLGTYFQRCLDPDCRTQGYGGPEQRLPTAVLATIPGFERAVQRERLPSAGPSLLYRKASPWEKDDQALAQALLEDPSLCP